MNAARTKRKAMLAALAAGTLFVNASGCLPKDFWYRYGGAGRNALIEALTENLVLSIADALIPPPESDS